MSAQNLITERLDLWTGAITKKSSSGRGNNGKVELTGIRRLRELIIELAVHGKLVEQDTSDVPAPALLDRLTELRREYITAKKIKNAKPLPPVSASDAPSRLPIGWAWTRLGMIAEINPRNAAEDDVEASFIPMPLITTSYHGDHGEEPRKWGDLKKGFSHFADGDIGLAKITPCFENGKAAVFRNLRNGIGAGTTELHVARPLSDAVNPYYILLFIKSPRFVTEGEKVMTGSAGQKRVPKDYFAQTPLPLPPKEEQHRIVQKVDELMALCDRLEQQTSDQLEAHETLVDTLLSTLTQSQNATELTDNWARLAAHFDTLFTTERSIDKLKQTILQLAVMGRLVEQDEGDGTASALLTDVENEKRRLLNEKKIKKPRVLISPSDDLPYEIPKSWKWEKLGNFALIGTGATPPRDRADYYSPQEYPWVTSGETNQEYIIETREKVSGLAVKETNVTIYPKGTLIVAMYGQGKTRGQISELKVAAGTNQACAAIQPIIVDEAHRRYIKLCFVKLYDEIREGAAGGAQPNLNTGKIANTLIPLPPLSEQHRIVKKVDELMALCGQIKERLIKANKTRCHLAESIVEQAVH